MYEEEDFDENLIVSTKTEYDGEENVLRPKTMAGYVGQEKVKENLSVYIAAAKRRGDPLRNPGPVGLRAAGRRGRQGGHPLLHQPGQGAL